MRNILFVDDEPRVLEGLEGLLRKQRRRWSMEFVVGGERALEVLAERAFDVVVTDLKMPKVDGYALLTHLEQHHPETVRVILSGQAEREAALASGNQAHQSLSKPCRPGEIETVLERSLALRELVADVRVRRALGRIRELPALPATYVRMSAATATEQFALADVADIVAADIGLSASVLKLANSAFFSSGRSVASVKDAVMLLGVDAVQSLSLTSAVLNVRGMSPAVRTFAEMLQEHAMLVAALATHLAGSAKREAFATAMLHDVGRMVLALDMPRSSGPTLPPRELYPDDGAEAEGDAHGPIGGYLLGLWGLPPLVFDAVAHHHDRPTESSSAVVTAIYWAERIVDEVSGDRTPTSFEIAGMHKLAQERGVVLEQARVATKEKQA
jgi:HD-like signal output (HDOD) protein